MGIGFSEDFKAIATPFSLGPWSVVRDERMVGCNGHLSQPGSTDEVGKVSGEALFWKGA